MYENLTDVLVWFAIGGGAMWLFGIVEARLLENWTFWHTMKSWIKKLVPIAFAALVGFLAQALISVDIVQYIPESMSVVILAAINWYFSQHEYQAIKNTSYAEATRLAARN